MLTFELLKEKEYSEWDAFVSEYNGCNVFSLSNWIIASSKLEGSIPHISVIKYKDQIICGFTGTVKKRFGVRVLEPPLFTPYNGVLISDKIPENIHKNDIENTLIKGLSDNADRIVISCYPEPISSSLFLENNNKKILRYTSILELKDNIDPKAGFKQDIKDKIRRASRLNAEIVEEYNPETFYGLLVKIFEKSKLPIKFNLRSFQTMLGILEEQKFIRMTFGKFDEVYAGGRILVFYKDVGFSWLSATDPEFYKTGINQYLRYHEIKRLTDENYRLYDFVGVNIPGIRRQKEAFGGKRYEYRIYDITMGIKAKTYKILQNRYRK
jgi:hypothetical protein